MHAICWQSSLLVTREMLGEDGKSGELDKEESVRKSRKRGAVKKNNKRNEMDAKVMSDP